MCNSLLTTHCITYYLKLTACYLLFTTYCLQVTVYNLLFITDLQLTVHNLLFTVYCSHVIVHISVFQSLYAAYCLQVTVFTYVFLLCLTQALCCCRAPTVLCFAGFCLPSHITGNCCGYGGDNCCLSVLFRRHAPLLLAVCMRLLQILWTFSIYLESVAILPQLFMISKTGEAETITSHYLFALGSYRALYILNWIYRYYYDGFFDLISVVSGCVQTILYCDFFYLYVAKGKCGQVLCGQCVCMARQCAENVFVWSGGVWPMCLYG